MHRFWIRWMYAAAGLTVLGGLCIAAFTGTPLLAPLEDPIRAVFWGSAQPDGAATTFWRFVFGVAGATMAGWGLTVLLLVRYGLAAGHRWAWWAVALPLDLWFVTDMTVSLYYAVWANVIFNAAFAVLFTIPLVATWRLGFRPRRQPAAATT